MNIFAKKVYFDLNNKKWVVENKMFLNLDHVITINRIDIKNSDQISDFTYFYKIETIKGEINLISRDLDANFIERRLK